MFLTVALGLAGCSTIRTVMSDPDAQALFNHAVELAEARIVRTDEEKPAATATAADAVPYDSLGWSYGGFHGEAAPLDAVARISSLSFNSSTLFYAWDAGNCEALGATSASDYNATICAVFCKNSAGVWVGGKFDWISTSRTSRGLNHCYDYEGWTMSGLPNPAEACFVIVSIKTGTRTNVIKGEWSR